MATNTNHDESEKHPGGPIYRQCHQDPLNEILSTYRAKIINGAYILLPIGN